MSNADEEPLSSHTVALRKAFRDCSDGVKILRNACGHNNCISLFSENRRASSSSELIRHAHAAADAHQAHRKQGIIDTLRRLDMDEERNSRSKVVDIVQVDQALINPYEFKQEYCMRNVPCIIRGLDVTDFAYVSSQWRSNDSYINTEWFRSHVGSDTLVPVRIIDPNNQNDDGLDGDGRAVECATVEMKLDAWIQYCRQLKDITSNSLHEVQASESLQSATTHYLKDWHLQFLFDKQHKDINKLTLHPPLYSLPLIFERDLLNNFLSRYTGGDYKFVYWGPPGSRTDLHSDVLHSFSWSYNVVGRKHWKFYIPNDDTENGMRSFELIQEVGETVFVPSKWKHEVTNLVETLSINHNWITTRNIDYTYECLLTEISSIEEEIQKWGVVSDDDFEVRENMLRGCVGIDLSMLVLMALLEFTELLNFVSCEQGKVASCMVDEDSILDCLCGIFCLKNVLNDIILDNQEKTINVTMRLTATLNSKAMAIDIVDYLKWCLQLTIQ